MIVALLHISGVGLFFLAIESLRLFSPGVPVADAFIAWYSTLLIAAAFFEFGLTQRIQWLVSTALTNLDRSQARAHDRGMTGNHIGILRVAHDCFCRDYSRNARLVMVIAIGSVLSFFAYTREQNLCDGLLLILNASALVAKKTLIAVLEGAGKIQLSKMLGFIPPGLMLLLILTWALFFNDTPSIYILGWAFLGGNILVICSGWRISEDVLNRIEGDALASSNQNSSLHWYLLSIAGSLQQNLLYSFAAYLGVRASLAPLFYYQKIMQVASEAVAATLRLSIYGRRVRYSAVETLRFARTRAKFLATIPPIASVIPLVLIPTQEVSLILLVAIVLVEGWATCYFVYIAQSGYCFGAPFHLVGTLTSQFIVALLLLIFGVFSGAYAIPLANIVAGVVCGYWIQRRTYLDALLRSENLAPSVKSNTSL